jgi:hypothetical protein
MEISAGLGVHTAIVRQKSIQRKPKSRVKGACARDCRVNLETTAHKSDQG